LNPTHAHRRRHRVYIEPPKAAGIAEKLELTGQPFGFTKPLNTQFNLLN
jgi:hypothetical protein